MPSSAHTARVGPDHRVELVLPDVPEGSTVGLTVEYVVLPRTSQPRKPGSAAGRVRIMPDFDDPLEEFETDKY